MAGRHKQRGVLAWLRLCSIRRRRARRDEFIRLDALYCTRALPGYIEDPDEERREESHRRKMQEKFEFATKQYEGLDGRVYYRLKDGSKYYPEPFDENEEFFPI